MIEIEESFPAPGPAPAGLAWDGSDLWNADFSSGRLYRLQPENAQVLDSLLCPGVLSGLAWDGQHLWQGLIDEGWLRAISPESHDFDRTLAIANAGRLAGVSWDGAHLWIVSQQRGLLLAVDREEGSVVHSLEIPVAAGGLDYHQGKLWVGVPLSMRFEAQSGTFAWSSTEQRFALLQLDPETGKELGRHALDFLPLGLAWVEDNLWLADARARRLHRACLIE